jgi:segregation and condensation protein B
MSMGPIELKSALEAIIYAADEPATIEQLAAALAEERHVVRAALDELVGSYGSDERGIEIRAVGGGYRVYTKPQHHEVVRRFIKSLRPPLRLTMPALETLAVIAYKQPVTQPEIQEIRGVNCAGVIQTLLERRLITTAGRKHVIGRPILYRTSKDFLMRFGLSDVDELPSLKEFEALAREALGTEDGVAEVPPEESSDQSSGESPVDPAAESSIASSAFAASDDVAGGEDTAADKDAGAGEAAGAEDLPPPDAATSAEQADTPTSPANATNARAASAADQNTVEQNIAEQNTEDADDGSGDAQPSKEAAGESR